MSANLNGCLSALVDAYNALAQYGTNQYGITFDVADYGGLRSEAQTSTILTYRQNDYNAALAAGEISADTTLQAFRPIAPYGDSWHDYGAAFDLEILNPGQVIDEQTALAVLGAYAPSIGLRWGGHFPDADPPHFELAIPIATARTLYAQQTGGTAADATGTASAFDPSTGGDAPDGLPGAVAGGDLAAGMPSPLAAVALAALAALAYVLYRRLHS